jgi:hypothetical protein
MKRAGTSCVNLFAMLDFINIYARKSVYEKTLVRLIGEEGVVEAVCDGDI